VTTASRPDERLNGSWTQALQIGAACVGYSACGKRLSHIQLVPDMPLTLTGKVVNGELPELAGFQSLPLGRRRAAALGLQKVSSAGKLPSSYCLLMD